MMSVAEAIAARHTHNGEFAQEPVRSEDIHRLASLAQRAPSSLNTQPWHFYWVLGREDIQAIADINGDCWHWMVHDGQFLERYSPNIHLGAKEAKQAGTGIAVDNMPPLIRPFARWGLDRLTGGRGVRPLVRLLGMPKQMARMQRELVESSPVVLVGCLEEEVLEKSELDRLYAIAVLGAAMENLWVTVGSLGMGMQFVSGPQEGPDGMERVARVVGVPAHHRITFIWRLGYVPEEQKPNLYDWTSPQRKPLGQSHSVKSDGGTLYSLPDEAEELRRSRGV